MTSHVVLKAIAISLLLLVVAIIPTGLVIGRESSLPVAEVPAELKKDPSYTQYAAILVQLDLLAAPVTARLPVTVSDPEPGMIELQGSVPSAAVKKHVIDGARRLSGLNVRESLRVDPGLGSLPSEDPGYLAGSSRETIQTLFPEHAEHVAVSSGEDGIIVLTGTISSYESKLLLTQAIMSQPGCLAVVSLLEVPVNPELGTITISELQGRRLAAESLPKIPAAPLSDAFVMQSTRQRTTSGKPIVAADDGPERDLLDRQVREDALDRLSVRMGAKALKLEVDAHYGQVTISGDLGSQEEVEEAVEAIAEVDGVTKVVAKCRPYSLQRNLPGGRFKGTTKAPAKEKSWLDWMTWGGSSQDGTSGNSWRFRSSLKKTIKRRCGKRLEELEIRNSLHGLVIEGEVESPRDRTFVLKQIDNVMEIRNLRYDVVLQITDF
ncbi:BON domain protein [Planctomycetes bacterium Pan216]|uniref:BON domain protein n=1 Tax=Kolteria novifilia TaxID=2527975 RepID=A0A518B2U4_9BACT|nr:BON domain protein [Planctomycetes bacterium Pan216]